ncbi:MAG: hypothetical protein HQ504_13105 [Rhodospirillaceae bacterium]|nr:hypothetical protein [Rhodospirillaceae bacterium]
MQNLGVGVYPARKKLPIAHYTEIGRIITRFAYIEMQLFHITYHVLGVNRKEGRLAVKQFRAGDQAMLIKELANLKGLKLNVDWAYLKKSLQELESYRDRLSHCIWIKHSKTKNPVLQDFSTSYHQNLPPGTKPKLTPLSTEVPLEVLKNIRISGDHISEELLKVESLVLTQIEP